MISSPTIVLLVIVLLTPAPLESFIFHDCSKLHLKKYFSDTKLYRSYVPFSYPLKGSKGQRLCSSRVYANNLLNSVDESSSGSLEAFVSTSGTYTAQFMPYWPSISTCTLVSGWNEQVTIQFIHAVEEVIRMNPVLAGRAIKTNFPVRCITSSSTTISDCSSFG